MAQTPAASAVAQTGIEGLDDVLAGGLPRGRLYLVQGNPGAGKTTLAVQFLLEGVRRGETGLYITLSESKRELVAVAASHGWSLEGLALYELEPRAEDLAPDLQQTIFPTAEVELTEAMQTLLEVVSRVKPTRVVFDSLSEIRLLAQSALRYRRQILALKHHFSGSESTVLLLDDLTSEPGDQQLESLAHGVLTLEQSSPVYGIDRRRLRITKLRGVRFRSGYHDFCIEPGGLRVYPRLVAAEHSAVFTAEVVPSGLAGLDALLGGGLQRGNSVLLIGPPGTGKSALVAQFLSSAARRGDHTALFSFEEGLGTMLQRADSLGSDMRAHIDAGRVAVRQVNPAALSPGEFVQKVREQVEADDARIVAIDSLNGYLMAMPQEQYLLSQLHELFAYLGQKGVVTLLTVAQHGFMGASMTQPVDASYLADVVILLRYFEAAGRIRKAISIVKKRSGAHEDMIREFGMGPQGLHIGEPLSDFQGVLTGVPMYTGNARPLMDEARERARG